MNRFQSVIKDTRTAKCCYSLLIQQFSTGVVATQEPKATSVNRYNAPGGQLWTRLSFLGATSMKVSAVIDTHIRQGNPVKKVELIDCIRSLRKRKRYQHCLQIFKWMDRHKYNYSEKDYGLYLDVLYWTKGIVEAKSYFCNLPPASKNLYTYGALLNCYCMSNMADEALALFSEMDKLNYASRLAFANIMTLYLKVGKPEEVPRLLQEMKERDLFPDSYIYNIVLQSFGALNDIESVERIAGEIGKEQHDWTVYTSLATVYAKNGHTEKFNSVLHQLEEFLKTSKDSDRVAYHYLLSFYASCGNLAAVNRVWDALRAKVVPPSNMCYFSMLQALSKLGEMEGLRSCFEEWESQCKIYDHRLPTLVIGAYLRHGMILEAEDALKRATERSKVPLCLAHEYFMAYFTDKSQIDKAMRHLEDAVDIVQEDTRWRPDQRRIYALFEYFERDKDVEKAEKLFGLLKKLNRLDSEAYLLLLRVYVSAEKTIPGVKWRMVEDGIDISSEHEKLLGKVSFE